MKKVIFVFIILTSYISGLKSQETGAIQINSNTAVHYIVIDSLGRKTGCDSRGIIESNILQEIPNSNYSFEENSHEFGLNLSENIFQNIFIINFFGIRTDIYSFSILIHRGTGITTFFNKISVRSVIEKDSVNTYKFTYNSQPGTKVTLDKIIFPLSLIRDVSAMSKLGWINTQTVRDKYINVFGNYRLQLDVRDYAAARTTLNNTLVELKQDSNISITADAQKLLTADIQQLLSEPPLLLSPQAATDTLMAQLSYAYSLAWIGDKNFVNELQNGLNNARKHLSKSDFTNCSKEIRTFQDKLKKEYDKKSTAKDKRFVSTEGYPYLYNNAQYIVDRIK